MDVADLFAGLRAARRALLQPDDQTLSRLLQDWSARWQDPIREVGEEGLDRLASSTGWPRPHLIEALLRAFRPWTPMAIRRGIARARRSRVAGNREGGIWLLAVLAGRIPALATGVVFRSLAARVPVALKPSSAEPVFCDLLQGSARRHSDLLAGAVRVVKDPALVASLVREAPSCLAYGRDETVDAFSRVRPGLPTWCGGHRESLVVVFQEALGSVRVAREVARRVAQDSAIYGQSGCLSPHVVLCEEGARVSPEMFAEMLHSSLASLQQRWPTATPTLEEAATLRLFAEESRFLAARAGGQVLPERGPVRPLVCLIPRGVYRPGPGDGVVQVLTFMEKLDFRRQLPSLAGRLQGIAVAGDRTCLERALDAAPEYRAPYICRPGRLQSPPADWLENGLDLTVELARLG